jgi:hypothetical protein
LDPGTVAIILKYVGELSESPIEQLGSKHSVWITASTIAVGFAVIWGLYWLMSKIWKWWEAEDLDAYFARAPYKPLMIGSICFWFVLALCIEFAMLYQFQVLKIGGFVTAVVVMVPMLFPVIHLVRERVRQEEQVVVGIALASLAFLMLLPMETVFFCLSSSMDQYILFFVIPSLPVVWLIIVLIFWCFRGRVFQIPTNGTRARSP